MGDHEIELVVTDSAGNSTVKKLSVSVLGKPEIVTQKEAKAKKEKILAPFVIPEIVIQNPRYITRDKSGNYLCASSAKTCSVNFALS